MSSRLSVAILAATSLLSTASALGAFSAVIDAPPDVIAPDSNFSVDTQINLHPGTVAVLGDVLSLGSDSVPALNVELNVLGGSQWAFQAWIGSQVHVNDGSVKTGNLAGGFGTMSGGQVERWSLYAKSHLEMSGGVAGRIDVAGVAFDPDNAFVELTGGDVGILDATGDVVIRGGEIDATFLRGGGSVELSGGVMSGAFEALAASRFNVRGSSFLIGGAEPVWPADGKLVVTQRDVALTGTLLDGQPFHFELNSLPGNSHYFSPEAVVTITLVPEPSALVLLAIGSVAIGCRRRR
jgi:hypothetical protein